MLDPNFYINKYVQILDKEQNIIVSGKVSTIKPDFAEQDILYISVDDKWYYSNQKCIFKIVEYADLIVPNEPPSFLKWEYWKKRLELGITVDVYRDFCYEEIDPPIKPYIDILNNVSPFIKTCESCCGHGQNWHIRIAFFNMAALNRFLCVLKEFEDKLILVSESKTFQSKNQVIFKFVPGVNWEIFEKIDDSDLSILKQFVKKLEQYFKLAI